MVARISDVKLILGGKEEVEKSFFLFNRLMTLSLNLSVQWDNFLNRFYNLEDTFKFLEKFLSHFNFYWIFIRVFICHHNQKFSSSGQLKYYYFVNKSLRFNCTSSTMFLSFIIVISRSLSVHRKIPCSFRYCRKWLTSYSPSQLHKLSFSGAYMAIFSFRFFIFLFFYFPFIAISKKLIFLSLCSLILFTQPYNSSLFK